MIDLLRRDSLLSSLGGRDAEVGALSDTTIRVHSEIVPLALWASSLLERAGYRVILERTPVARYEMRYRAGIGMDKLRGVTDKIRPFHFDNIREDDYMSGDSDIVLALGGEAFGGLDLVIAAESKRMMDTVVGGARDCGLMLSKHETLFIPANRLIINESIGPFQRAVLMWLAQQYAPGFEFEIDDGGGSKGQAKLLCKDPELESMPLQARYPVVLEGDDSESLDEMRHWLLAQGFRVEQESAAAATSSEPLRLEVVNGPLRTMEGLAWISQISGKLGDMAEQRGIDSSRYPIYTRKKFSEAAVVRVRMPLAASKAQTLTPWSGPYPERFPISIHTDEPENESIQDLMRRLNRSGFTNISTKSLRRVDDLDGAEIFSVPIPGSVHVGGLATHPRLAKCVERSVNRAMERYNRTAEFPCVVEQRFDDEEDSVRIYFPVAGMSDGQYKSRLEAPELYCVTLFTGNPTLWEPLRVELADRGFEVRVWNNSSKIPTIRYGAARPAVLAMIQEMVNSVSKVDLEPIHAWSADDRDIHLQLPDFVEQDSDPEEFSEHDLDDLLSDGLDEFEEWSSDPREQTIALDRDFLHIDGDDLWVGSVRLSRRSGVKSPYVPEIDPTYCLDSVTAETMIHIANSVRMNEPCLLEGETASSKTSAIIQLAAHLNQPLKRINLHGQSDTSDLIGRFVPTSNEDRHGNNAPGSSNMVWGWQDGDIVRAIRNGWWVILDEINLAEPQILERLNSLLELRPSLIVTENDGEKFGGESNPIHPDFRIFATMNPAEYVGRFPLSPAYKDRWCGYLYAKRPGEAEYLTMLNQLVFGIRPNVLHRGRLYRSGNVDSCFPKLASVPECLSLLQSLAKFQVSLESLTSRNNGTTSLSSDRKELPVFTRRSLLSFMRYLDSAALDPNFNLREECSAALQRYYLSRIPQGPDQIVVQDLLDACGIGSNQWLLGGKYD
jgi:hypothetical protein